MGTGTIMSNKAYREHDGVSRSELFVILSKTPLHFKYAQDHHEDDDTLALLEGRAIHKMILEPDTFADEFAVAPKVDRRTKEGKETYEAVLNASAGKDVLTEDSMTKVVGMANALKQNPDAVKFLTGDHERSFFWTDADTGEACKVRPDCLTEVDNIKYIVDYKTTESCSDGAFERSCRKYGYKFQAGMYREGVFQNTFEELRFVFVAQEKKPPYASRVYICTDGFVNEGYAQFRKAIETYHECKESGNWYGYDEEILIEEDEIV